MLQRKTFLTRKKPLRASTKATRPKKRVPSKLEDKTLRELDKTAWEWFSRYVRLRDSEWRGGGGTGSASAAHMRG